MQLLPKTRHSPKRGRSENWSPGNIQNDISPRVHDRWLLSINVAQSGTLEIFHFPPTWDGCSQSGKPTIYLFNCKIKFPGRNYVFSWADYKADWLELQGLRRSRKITRWEPNYNLSRVTCTHPTPLLAHLHVWPNNLWLADKTFWNVSTQQSHRFHGLKS